MFDCSNKTLNYKMENLCLPSSPNWYCNRILDCNDDGLLAFGSRHCIVLLNCREIPKSSPTFIGCFAAHNERVSGIAFCPFEGQTNLLASVGDDRAVVVTDTVNKTPTVLHEQHLVSISSKRRNRAVIGNSSTLYQHYKLIQFERLLLIDEECVVAPGYVSFHSPSLFLTQRQVC